MSPAAMAANSPATRSCNGPDLGKVDWHYIAPGKPGQNAFIESFKKLDWVQGHPLIRCYGALAGHFHRRS
jgi:hypothetical protein